MFLPLLATLVTAAEAAPLDLGEAPTAAVGYRPYRPYRGPPPRRGPPPHARHRAAMPPDSPNDVSLTLDAVDLAFGEVSLGGEFALGRRYGMVVRGGYGFEPAAPRWHVGLEARSYLLGDFDLGLFAGLRVEGREDPRFDLREPVLAVGPTVGGKITIPGTPLTGEASLGADVLTRTGFVALAPRFGVGLGVSF